jgi:hypothetical protein
MLSNADHIDSRKIKAVALQRLLGIRDYFDYTYYHSCIMDTDVYQSGEKA